MQTVYQTSRWMRSPVDENIPHIAIFRNVFTIDEACEKVLEYSADEVAMVFLDGEFIHCGPEHGSFNYYYTARVPLKLAPGKHVLSFRVNCLSWELRPYGQETIRHGLAVFNCEDWLPAENFGCHVLDCQLDVPQPDWGIAPKVTLHKNSHPETVYGLGDDDWFKPVVWFEDNRDLYAPELPHVRRDEFTSYRREGDFIYLDRYEIFFAEYLFEGEGTVTLRYYESRRNIGCGAPEPGMLHDTFEVQGSLRWHDLWYRSGKVAEIRCSGTARLKDVHFYRTGYPFVFDLMKKLPEDARQANLLKKALHTLECCTYDIYMDCPYYEQLMYVADTRVQMLETYAISSDHRLARKGVRMLSLSNRVDGALACRNPGKDKEKYYNTHAPTARANPLIPGFALLYPQMVHDYGRLREDDELVRSLLPVVRNIIDWALSYMQDGIVRNLPGWNFIDWLPNWENGIPTDCVNGCGCTLNWFLVRTLKDAADLERVLGCAENQQRYEALAAELTENIIRKFYVPEKGGFAENEERNYFSEHAQVWALVAADRQEVMDFLCSGTLDECGIYFSFYYLCVMKLYGREDMFAKRMERYLTLAEDPDLDTMPEEFKNWRSYCHAWSGNCLYFYNVDRVNLLDKIK